MPKIKSVSKDKIENLPKKPGVYILKGKSGEFLYIGKATNIQERVKTHFSQPNYRDELFIEKVSRIGYIETWSEIEALLLESELIKKHQPKYNVIWKDDKNYFFVGVTKEKLPRVFITHQKKDLVEGTDKKVTKVDYIGPFVDGKQLKNTLKLLRRIFPFYYTLAKHPYTLCQYCNLGLCPGPNPNAREYRKNISGLLGVLKGKRKSVIKSMQKEMSEASVSNNFEKAAKIRDQIRTLEGTISNARIAEYSHEKLQEWDSVQKILGEIIGTKRYISRIEAFDISNIQGKAATGSMVTFIKGRPAKDFYRKFRIRMVGKPNDVAMIKEVLGRRFGHPEWGVPDLILIDGGKPQLNAALSSLEPNLLNIKVASLAKRREELYLPGHRRPLLMKTLSREVFNLILQLRDEAHRFAITYHRKLRDIDFGSKR